MRMGLAFQRAGTRLPLFSLSLCRRREQTLKRNIFVVLGMVIFLFGFCTVSETQEKAVAQEEP